MRIIIQIFRMVILFLKLTPFWIFISSYFYGFKDSAKNFTLLNLDSRILENRLELIKNHEKY